MNGDDYREKRTATRFEVNIPVNYFVHDQSEPVNYGATRDISSVGLGLISEQQAAQGAVLDICLKVPEGQFLKLRGRVVWTSAQIDGKYRIGIELEGEKLKPVPILLQVVQAQRHT